MSQMSGGLMALSAAFSAFGAFAQGQSVAQAHNFNMRVEQQQAQVARESSYNEAAQTEREAAQRKGAAKAALGASGVDANAGSSLHVLNEIAAQGEMARQLNLYQGKINALAHEEQADAERQAASAAKAAGWINAGSTLLSAAATGSAQQRTPSGSGGVSGSRTGNSWWKAF